LADYLVIIAYVCNRSTNQLKWVKPGDFGWFAIGSLPLLGDYAVIQAKCFSIDINAKVTVHFDLNKILFKQHINHKNVIIWFIFPK